MFSFTKCLSLVKCLFRSFTPILSRLLVLLLSLKIFLGGYILDNSPLLDMSFINIFPSLWLSFLLKVPLRSKSF